jgi:acetylornithine deacetylase
MKGFAACAVAAMLSACARPLAAPLILCLSHDEEVGCRGVGSAIARMAASLPRPRLVLVGEPTGMQVVTGHKGKVALRSVALGRAGHSAAAPLSVNAIDLIADLILAIRAEAVRAAAEGPFDADFPVPHATLHAGRVAGGVQVNIVAERAVLDWEVRSPAGDDPAPRLARIAAALAPGVAAARQRVPEAGIETAESWRYPGLAADPGAPGVALACRLAGCAGTGGKVSYGTEGGLFAAGLGADTVVCGPGSMDQGHIADEWIERSELAAAQAMLGRVVDLLAG